MILKTRVGSGTLQPVDGMPLLALLRLQGGRTKAGPVDRKGMLAWKWTMVEWQEASNRSNSSLRMSGSSLGVIHGREACSLRCRKRTL